MKTSANSPSPAKVRVPKIPKGWRKMRAGEIVRKGDRYRRLGNGRFMLPPHGVSFIGDRVGDNAGDLTTQPWVRRLPAKGANKGGK